MESQDEDLDTTGDVTCNVNGNEQRTDEKNMAPKQSNARELKLELPALALLLSLLPFVGTFIQSVLGDMCAPIAR